MRQISAIATALLTISLFAAANGAEKQLPKTGSKNTASRSTSQTQSNSAQLPQTLEAKWEAEAKRHMRVALRQPAKVAEGERRCAYLGYWGSFHITGDIGTAAYALGSERFVADLAFEKEDNAHWYYRAGFGGDKFTSQWAFSRQPDRCGRYWVWRSDRGGWHRYEATRAWGDPLTTGSESQQVRTERSVNQRLTDLEEDVSELKLKVNTPQATQP